MEKCMYNKYINATFEWMDFFLCGFQQNDPLYMFYQHTEHQEYLKFLRYWSLRVGWLTFGQRFYAVKKINNMLLHYIE